MLTDKEKIEALKALFEGNWDNPSLNKVGNLFSSFEKNVKLIIYK